LEVLIVGIALIALIVVWRKEPSVPATPPIRATLSGSISPNRGPSPRLRRNLGRRAPFSPLDSFIRNAELTLARVKLESDPMRAEEMIGALVDSIGTGDIPAVLHGLQMWNPSYGKGELESRLFRRWVENDLRSAGDWAVQMPAGTTRTEAIVATAIGWANRDLPGAIAWVRDLPDSAERQNALLYAAYEAARTAPVDALTLADEIVAIPARNDLVTHAAMQWAAVEPEKSAAWAKEIQDPLLRARVLSTVATAWGDREPTAAAELTLGSLNPGRLQDDAVIGIVQRWVQAEPKAAAAWVGQFPDGELKDTAVSILAGTAIGSGK
jgi:hypothetical protein